MADQKHERKNDKGEPLGEAKTLLKNPDYDTGKYSDDYTPLAKWEEYRQPCSDEDGFNKEHKEENGEYYMVVVLPKGMHIIRYGTDYGRFTAPKGTPYEQLGLPYIQDTVEYHAYVVKEESVAVYCQVKRGRVAPIFDSPGGGVQFWHFKTIRSLLRKQNGVSALEEVFP